MGEARQAAQQGHGRLPENWYAPLVTFSSLFDMLTSLRWVPSNPPNHLHVRRLDPTLARHSRPPLRAAILVREVTHVLDARRLGAILRRMDTELPTRAAGQRKHQCVGHRMRQHDCAGCRGTRGDMGACHTQAYACRNREAAREGRSDGIQGGPEACEVWREGAVVAFHK